MFTSSREGVFCFLVKGRRIAADMKTVMEKLKARFIDQDGLAPQQAVEQQMASLNMRRRHPDLSVWWRR